MEKNCLLYNDEELKSIIELDIEIIEDYFRTCGFCFIHLTKALNFSKIAKENDIQVTKEKIIANLYLSSKENIKAEEPLYKTNIKGLEYVYWR